MAYVCFHSILIRANLLAAAPSAKPNTSQAKKPGQDLIFKAKAPSNTNFPALPILAKLPAMITMERLRPAWRQYIIDLLGK